MVVNITTTLDVAQKIEKTDIVDIVAISIDDYRTGKDWDKYAAKVTLLSKRLRSFGIEFNCNLSYNAGTQIAFLFNTMTRRKFLIETFDYTTALWPKPLVEAEALTQMAGKLIIKGRAKRF